MYKSVYTYMDRYSLFAQMESCRYTYHDVILSVHKELPHSVLIAALQFYYVVIWLYHNLNSPLLIDHYFI